MRSTRFRWAIPLATLFLLGVMPQPAWCQDLKVGAALVDITPGKGDSHYRGKGQGTHDPLYARALYLEQGETRVGVVLCDLINVSRELTGPARRLAAKKTGIPAGHIVVAATHTHTGPVSHNDPQPGEKGTYAARVRDSIVAALEKAQAKARPATLEVGKALQNPIISFNRRFHLKNGRVQMNPGIRNPDILRPEGPIDPEVCILLAKDKETGHPFAALTHFSMHLDTVGTGLYSADYPYYIEQFFLSQYGNDFVSLFGTGCCGDINHVDVLREGPQRGHDGGYQSTRYLGGALADTLKRHLAKLEAIKTPQLAAQRTILPLPLQTYTPEELKWAKDPQAKALYEERPFLQEYRRHKIRSLEKLRAKHGDTMPIEVQTIRLGESTALVFLPGEVFVELGMAIKNASPFPNTFVVELANDNIAYVPTRRAFANGDYETINSRLQPGSGEGMVQAAVRLLMGWSAETAKKSLK